MTTSSEPRGLKRATRKSPGLRVLVIVLITLTFGLGGLGYYRYRSGETYILKTLAKFEQRGATLSVERCVDELVGWSRRCQAMESMCLQSVPRLMRACLRGQDRLAYCKALAQPTGDTRFGYKECQSRGAKRGLPKKACAQAYRQIDAHCKRARDREVPAEHSAKR
ncbi:MAG: hypothetical protein KC503_11910 [Myxococcales bacterium]|nr:hypothetical protein [Myxococcales bacterium]